MDGQPGQTMHGGCEGCPGQELVREAFVTAENINELFDQFGVPQEFDLLTIDTDFNDYWIWKAILEQGWYQPRVVAVDFNPDIPIDKAKTVHYNATGEWDGTRYTVASLLAYTLLARDYGYEFVYALEMGAHAFFVRKDLLHPSDYDLPIRNVLKESHHADLKQRQFFDTLRFHGFNDESTRDKHLVKGHEHIATEEFKTPKLMKN